MNQPIAGVAVLEADETEVQTVWPSIAVYDSGRWLGRLYEIRWPDIYFFHFGYLLALLSIPHALFLYFYRVAPKLAIRYTLTNRRVTVVRGLLTRVERAIELEEFDEIEIQQQDGYAWYHAGDLVFKQNGTEVFRLDAVTRPDVFRHGCMSVRQAVLGVREIRQQQAACA